MKADSPRSKWETDFTTLAVLQGMPAVVAALLQRGADPGVRDARGRSALSYAREAGNGEIVARLLGAGAVD